jgi:uncharacterized membrane protein YuzA (DUF378 family)
MKERRNTVTNINPITWLAVILLAVGGINWGLVGLFEFDLVAYIFGEEFGETNMITRIVYILVGVSALVTLAGLAMTQSRSPTQSGRSQSSLSRS